MSLFNQLEKKFSKYSVQNLTIILIIGQILFFGLQYSKILPLEDTALIGREVLAGQYWRLLFFLFIPITDNPLFACFAWYLYFLYGTALEREWGIFRYNIFLFLSYVFTLIVAFIFPDIPITNTYIFLSIFLAFAYLFPDFQLMIFFILPVKVKWLAWLQWIGYAFLLLFGTWPLRVLILASVGNFLIFFGNDMLSRIKYGRRRKIHAARESERKEKPVHVCSVCGLTDKQDPNMDFRYCNHCGYKCYCMDHLATHVCEKQ